MITSFNHNGVDWTFQMAHGAVRQDRLQEGPDSIRRRSNGLSSFSETVETWVIPIGNGVCFFQMCKSRDDHSPHVTWPWHRKKKRDHCPPWFPSDHIPACQGCWEQQGLSREPWFLAQDLEGGSEQWGNCLVGGLEHEFYFPFSWECHHPNWRSHIFQRGRYTTNQYLMS